MGYLCLVAEQTTSIDDKPNNPEIEEATFKNPTMIDNSLAFQTRDDFSNFIAGLQKTPLEQKDEFIDRHAKGFISLNKKKNQLAKNKSLSASESDIMQLDVKDPNFASILNEDGVFQIDEQVFKITNQYTYIFKNREAFETFSFPDLKEKTSGTDVSYVESIEPCPSEPQQLEPEVYRVENCDGGGGGGGNYPEPEPENPYAIDNRNDLDPYADIDVVTLLQ